MPLKTYVDPRRQFAYNSKGKYLKKDRLSITIVKNGTILPAHIGPNGCDKLWANGGVLNEHGEYVDKSGNGHLFGGKYEYRKSDVDVKYIDEEVIFFGPFVKHWGHFLCDQISRLWYIKNNPSKYKIAYCGWTWRSSPSDFCGNYLELLELLGCSKDQFINIEKPTKFKKIIIPDLSFKSGEYYTKEFNSMIDIIVKNAINKSNLKSPSKIYFSRAKLKNNAERGEKKIETLFKNNGYRILYPEELTATEQIIYFNKANQIAMISGSISHNLMFTRSDKVNATILNKFALINDYQLVIDDLTHANISYIDAFKSFKPVLFGAGPFLIAPSKYLKKYFNDNKLKYQSLVPFSILDLLWYFKTYHKIYSNPTYKKLLQEEQARCRHNGQIKTAN